MIQHWKTYISRRIFFTPLTTTHKNPISSTIQAMTRDHLPAIRPTHMVAAGLFLTIFASTTTQLKAQLSSGENTFSGTVPATCEFSSLADSVPMSLFNGTLRGESTFNLVFRAPGNIKVTAKYITLEQPVNFTSLRMLSLYDINAGNSMSTLEENFTMSKIYTNPNPSSLNSLPAKIGMSAQAPTVPGNYSYQVTLTCLLQ